MRLGAVGAYMFSLTQRLESFPSALRRVEPLRRSLRVANTTYDAPRVQQMTGRAGRAGLDTRGEAFILCEPREEARAAADPRKLPLRTPETLLDPECRDMYSSWGCARYHTKTKTSGLQQDRRNVLKIFDGLHSLRSMCHSASISPASR